MSANVTEIQHVIRPPVACNTEKTKFNYLGESHLLCGSMSDVETLLLFKGWGCVIAGHSRYFRYVGFTSNAMSRTLSSQSYM